MTRASPVPDDLYDRDVLIWSEQQADLLRRLAAGERVNDAVDWANLIDEVESVGLSELRACRSLLRHALIHLLKLYAWPGSQVLEHWRGEATTFLADARDSFAPSMRQRIDLADIYADALHAVQGRTNDSGEPLSLPNTCPFTLNDLLAVRPDVGALAAKLSTSA